LSGFSRRQWLLALALAALIHGSAAFVVLHAPPDAGSVAAGAGGITVGLGPAGRAPGSVDTVPPPAADSPEPFEDADAVTSDVRPADDVPPEDAAEPQALETGETVAAATAHEAEPDPVEAIAAVAADPSAAIEEARARAAIPPPPRAEIRPAPRKPPPPRQEGSEPPTAEPAVEAAELAGADGKAGDRDQGDVGNGENAGGGAARARADYFAVLQAWLEQHKVYPGRAVARRLEGVVALRFVMDRRGQVIDYVIERSSGHRLLDHAAETLLERAQPLPTMPDEIGEASLTIVVPISFVLN
jgi:protein TonB